MKQKYFIFFVIFAVFSVFTAIADPLNEDKSGNQDSYEIYKNNYARYMDSYSVDEIYDPIEPVNRFMFGIHNGVDHLLLKPFGQIYDITVPSFGKDIVRNFFANLGLFVTIPNQFLQGSPDLAFESIGRLLLNATIGVGGMFDVASEQGMPYHQEDFGNTLAVYDIPHGPYLFIPILGPSSVRDLTGKVVDYRYVNLVNKKLNKSQKVLKLVTEGISKRAYNIDFIDNINRTSIDPYSTMRSLYLQNRNSKIIKSKTK